MLSWTFVIAGSVLVTVLVWASLMRQPGDPATQAATKQADSNSQIFLIADFRKEFEELKITMNMEQWKELETAIALHVKNNKDEALKKYNLFCAIPRPGGLPINLSERSKNLLHNIRLLEPPKPNNLSK